jgi:plasmid stability protein
MGQLTIRKVDDELIRRLKIRAAANRRSAEAEVRAILEATLKEPQQPNAFWERAALLRAQLAGRWTGDSAELVRQGRDDLTKKFE